MAPMIWYLTWFVSAEDFGGPYEFLEVKYK